jgi:adenylate kinase family enzyme
VSVVGNSGSGKTSLARRLAAALGVAHVELDAIFHQPGWTELPAEEFRRRVDERIAADGWVVDGTYSVVRDLVWAAADTVVWMDLPRPVVMRQILRRTIVRAATRRELWNGNREPATGLFRLDPRENIVLWSWTRHDHYARLFAAAAADPANAHLTFVRVRSRADADRIVTRAAGGLP